MNPLCIICSHQEKYSQQISSPLHSLIPAFNSDQRATCEWMLLKTCGKPKLVATATNTTPLVPLSGFKSALSFLLPEIKHPSWVQMTAPWSREWVSVPVDEAVATDRDPVQVVSCLCPLANWGLVADRGAWLPLLPPQPLTELARPRGQTDDGRQKREQRLGEKALR